MYFTLHIDVGGDAFCDELSGDPDPGPELARLLRDLASWLLERPQDFVDGATTLIIDANGRAVGEAGFTTHSMPPLADIQHAIKMFAEHKGAETARLRTENERLRSALRDIKTRAYGAISGDGPERALAPGRIATIANLALAATAPEARCPHCAEPLAKVKRGSICDACGWQDIDPRQGREPTADGTSACVESHQRPTP